MSPGFVGLDGKDQTRAVSGSSTGASAVPQPAQADAAGWLEAPQLGQADTNTFLESLAQIAATPQARRSLRNSLRSGYSAGGVIQALGNKAHAAKLIAQGSNATLAICGEESAQREAETRLLDLADSSPFGRRAAEAVCADVKEYFKDFVDTEADG